MWPVNNSVAAIGGQSALTRGHGAFGLTVPHGRNNLSGAKYR
jgi:hypothetical protein